MFFHYAKRWFGSQIYVWLIEENGWTAATVYIYWSHIIAASYAPNPLILPIIPAFQFLELYPDHCPQIAGRYTRPAMCVSIMKKQFF